MLARCYYAHTSIPYTLSYCCTLSMNGSEEIICAARQAFARGVLANWLVCVAVWQAGAASSLPGKFLGAWLPVSAFVALGLEHSARPRPFYFSDNGFCPG